MPLQHGLKDRLDAFRNESLGTRIEKQQYSMYSPSSAIELQHHSCLRPSRNHCSKLRIVGNSFRISDRSAEYPLL